MVDRREHAATVQSTQDPHDHGDTEPTQAEALSPGLLAHDENDRRGDQDHPRDGVGSRDAQDCSGQSDAYGRENNSGGEGCMDGAADAPSRRILRARG